MKSITKRIISTLAICGALVLEAGATAIGSLGKALNNIAKVDAAGTTVTYKQSSTSAASVSSGTAPTGSSVTFSTTYTNKDQLTKGNSMTYTLSGYAGYKITALSMSMKSNSKAGSGKFSLVAGSTTIAQIANNTDFNQSAWHGSWSSSYVDVDPAMTKTDYVIQKGEDLVLTISASVNSLYCQSITLTYEQGTAANQLAAPTNIAYSNGTLTWNAVEHATGYKVSVNDGTPSTITSNSKILSLSYFDTVSIIATDSNSTYTDSSAGEFVYLNYGTEQNPLTVSEAIPVIEAATKKVNSAYTNEKMYVRGTVTEDATYNGSYSNYDKVILSDSSNTLTVQRCVQKNGATTTIAKGSVVIAYGYGEYYNGATLYPLSDKSNPPQIITKSLSSIAVSGQTTEFTVGNEFSFGGTVTATYSDSSTANVTSSATFSGYSMSTPGTQKVTVSYSDSYGSATTDYNITVSVPATPYISPDESSITGYTETSADVGVSYGNLLGTFSATSGNPSVATVTIKSNLSGRAVLTIGYVAVGNATISLKDGANELATIAVSVSLSTVTISGMPATNSVYIDKTLDLGSLITVTPTGSCGSGVTWSTTDGGKATVDSNGVVTGVAAGTTTITATPDDYSAGAVSCTVTVSEAPLETTYDFVTNFSTYSDSWDSKTSYVDRDQLTHEDLGSEFAATVDLHYTSRQNSGAAIDNMPVFATKTSSGSYKDVLDFTLNETDYTISHITVTFVQWGTKTPDVALFSGTSASGTALDSITISGTTLSLNADVEDLTSFSVGYCDKSTSNVQAGLASINLQFKAKKSLTSIAVSNSHRSFDNGAEFVKETVTAHYSDSTSPIVSGATYKIKKDLEGSEFTDIPETLDMSYNNATVQVSYSDSYGSASTSYTINVDYVAATKVELNPTSTDVEKGKTFDLSDVAVTISPSTADPDDYEWSIKNKTEVGDSTLVGDTFTAGNNTGTVTLTCTAGSASADFVINVVDEPVPQITSFTAEGTPSKATQYRNATFALNLTGITLKAVYDIKDPETIGSDQFDWDTTGTHPIGTYKFNEDLTVTVGSITLADDFINSISFTASSDMSKKEYWVGDSWDFTGLAIEGKWISGADLDVDADKVSFTTTSTTSAAGVGLSIEVTAHYEGFKGTEPTLTVSGITIREVEMESLSIDYTGGQPTLGEKFTFAGSITGNMSDGNTQSVDADDVTFSEIDKYITTEQTVTVTHKTTGATGTFKVQYKSFEPQKTYEYQLVDSALEDYSGQYLIVYEPDSIAMPGNNSTPGAAQAHVDISDYWVSDEHEAIKYNTSTSALSFTIEATDGGYYLYTTVDVSTVYIRSETSSKNGMQYASKPTANFINTFSYESDTGETQLHGVLSTNILHYNDTVGSSGEMFRFYKEGSQKAVQYYKLVETGSEEADLIKLNVSCSKTFKEGETLNISDLTVNGLYNDGNTKAITSGVTFNDGSSSKVLEPGDNNLTVKYGDKLTESITITAAPLVKYDLSVTIDSNQAEYSIYPGLTDGKLIGGKDYTIEVSAKEGYVIDSVTATGTGAAVSGNIVTITNASGDVSIEVESHRLQYAIDCSGIDSKITTNPTEVPANKYYGEKLEFSISYNKFLYEIDQDTLSITMVGTDDNLKDCLNQETGVLSIEKVTGNVAITINLNALEYTVDIQGDGYTAEITSLGDNSVVIQLTADEHWTLPAKLDGYDVSGTGTITVPASDFVDKVLTLNGSAVHDAVSVDLSGLNDNCNIVHVDGDPTAYNSEIIYTIKAKDGYVLPLESDYEDFISVTCYGEAAEFTYELDGDEAKLTFMIMGNMAVTTDLQGSINQDIDEKIEISNDAERITIGEPYYAVLSFPEGVDNDSVDFYIAMYDESGSPKDLHCSYDATNRQIVIDIDEVTGGIIIEASCDLQTFSIAYDGEHYSSTSALTEITYGEKLEVTITADPSDGYTLTGVSVTMVGSEPIIVTAGHFVIEKVTGNVSIDVETTAKPVSITANGNITVDPESSDYGSESVTVTVSPKDGYAITENSLYYTIGDDDTHHTITGNSFVIDTLTKEINVYGETIAVYNLSYDLTDLTHTEADPYIQKDLDTFEIVLEVDGDKSMYGIDMTTFKVEMGGEDITGDITKVVYTHDKASGKITINLVVSELTGDIKVTAARGSRLFDVSVTGQTDLVEVTGDLEIAYDSTGSITFTPADHYHFEANGIQVVNSGSAEVLLDSQPDGSVILHFLTGVKGDVSITVAVVHDLVSVTTGTLEHITFDFTTVEHENIEYGTTVTGHFTAEFGYERPISITVTCYGELLEKTDYAYNKDTGVFSINAMGDIVISAKGTQGQVEVVATGDEHVSFNDGDGLPAITDSGLPFIATVEAEEGYKISSIVVTMNGSEVPNAYNEATGTITIQSVNEKINIAVTTVKLHSVEYDIENVTISDHIYEVVDNGTYTLVILVNDGYELKNGAVSVTMGGEDVTADVLGEGVIFISQVTGDVQVSIKATKKSFSVTNTLTNASNSSAAITSVEYGASYQAVISAVEGYENLTCTVKMGGVDVPCVNGVIIISKVTGAIEITASAVASKVNVSVDVTNVTCTIDSQQVDYNSSLEFKLTQDDNTFDYVYSVTMGGEPVDGLNGVYTIEHVTGEIVIEASATEIVATGITATLDDDFKVVDYDSEFPIGRVTVVVSYNDGSTSPYDGEITFSGYNKAQYGIQSVTISAAGFTTSVEIEVLKSIVVQEVTDISTYEASYDFGYNLTIEDIIVFYDTTDGLSHADAPDEIVEGSYDITISGNQNVQVRFDGQVYDVLVHINASTEIKEISAAAKADSYDFGYALKASDFTVLATYTDGLTATINAEYIEFDGKAGVRTVIVHAAGLTDSVEVTINASTVIESISAVAKADSYEYGHEMQVTDFTVTATYTDGHTATIDATKVEPSSLASGLNVVTVTASGKTCTVVVKVNDSEVVDSISAVIKDGKDTVAYEGAFTADDVTVYATYTDGKTKVVTGFTMSGFDNKHIGVNTVTITLGDKTCTVKVTVLASTVVDHIEATATKDNLTYGDTFTKDDVKVTEVYTDGHKVENLAADSISGFTGKVGVNNVTVVYGGKEASIQVTVKASKVIESIEAVVNEGKAELEYGAAFTKDDVIVTATYTDGNTAVVAADSVDFAGTVGENTVVVHVGDKTCEVKVTVKPSEIITGIEVSTEKTNVEYGGTFTKDDVKAQYVYSDGHKVDATVDSISGFSATTLGKQVITVKVGEYSATLEITVSGRVALSLEVIGYNDTVDQGKDFVFTGKVIANYNDGTTEEVTAYTMEAVDTSKAGKKTVKVTFENVSATFDINVIQTKTEIEPTYMTAIIGGSVVGVAILAVGIFLFLKSFKL